MKFVQSQSMSNLYLLQDVSNDQTIVYNEIVDFIKKNPPNDLNSLPTLHFFKYTTDEGLTGFEKKGTSYFIENLPDAGGFSSEDLDNYPDEKIAAFSISKCSNDTAQYVGTLYYYGLEGLNSGFEKKDTIVFDCKN